MKVAVFSDVQAVLPALEAVIEHIEAWRPDMVVMAGDLVNRGPDSGGCLELFDRMRREQGWLPVNGNHEVWVLSLQRGAAYQRGRAGDSPLYRPGLATGGRPRPIGWVAGQTTSVYTRREPMPGCT